MLKKRSAFRLYMSIWLSHYYELKKCLVKEYLYPSTLYLTFERLNGHLYAIPFPPSPPQEKGIFPNA